MNYGYTSEQLLSCTGVAGGDKLTLANLADHRDKALKGGSVVYRLVRDALLDVLPIEAEDPDAEQMAMLLAFRAIVAELDALDNLVEPPQAAQYRLAIMDNLDVAELRFLLDAWHEAMDSNDWSLHETSNHVLTDEGENLDRAIWLQNGKKKMELERAKAVIAKHVCDLIDFQIKVLTLHLSERLKVEDWLEVYKLTASSNEGELLAKRLKLVLLQ